MEYDPAFPTEDNDEEIDHIIDVTDIPLPVSKKKNRRQSKLMKIPLPVEKIEIVKPLVETSNSPPQEPDTSWLLPTSTQAPLKFNILKSNTIKPTDEENSIFEDLEVKVEPTKAPKILPKKSKPMTLPTGVIVKNADFVVNEPKTSVELFLPPKITSTESNSISNMNMDVSNLSYVNSTNPNMIAALNNPNMINSYPLMNMSYIIPQKLRSAQMISQPLVANPAIASASQKKAHESSLKTENRKRSRSSSRSRKHSRSKSPKNGRDRSSKKSKSKSPKPKLDPSSGGDTQAKKESSLRKSHSRSVSHPLDGTDKREARSTSKDKPRNRSTSKHGSPNNQKSNRQYSPSRSISPNRSRRSTSRDIKPGSLTKHRRSGSRASISQSRSRNDYNNHRHDKAAALPHKYQQQQQQSRGLVQRQRSTSRSRRSPNQTRSRRDSDSRGRRSNSPHWGFTNRYRRSPSPNRHRNHGNYQASPPSGYTQHRMRSRSRQNHNNNNSNNNNNNRMKPFNRTNRSRSRKRSMSPQRRRSGSNRWHRNERSPSGDNAKGDQWERECSIEVGSTRKKDCWAAESESGSHSTPVRGVAELCDSEPVAAVKEASPEDNVTTVSEVAADIVEENIIVSSSNIDQSCSMKLLDKNGDATVSSTVDETKGDYLSDFPDMDKDCGGFVMNEDDNEKDEKVHKQDEKSRRMSRSLSPKKSKTDINPKRDASVKREKWSRSPKGKTNDYSPCKVERRSISKRSGTSERGWGESARSPDHGKSEWGQWDAEPDSQLSRQRNEPRGYKNVSRSPSPNWGNPRRKEAPNRNWGRQQPQYPMERRGSSSNNNSDDFRNRKWESNKRIEKECKNAKRDRSRSFHYEKEKRKSYNDRRAHYQQPPDDFDASSIDSNRRDERGRKPARKSRKYEDDEDDEPDWRNRYPKKEPDYGRNFESANNRKQSNVVPSKSKRNSDFTNTTATTTTTTTNRQRYQSSSCESRSHRPAGDKSKLKSKKSTKDNYYPSQYSDSEWRPAPKKKVKSKNRAPPSEETDDSESQSSSVESKVRKEHRKKTANKEKKCKARNPGSNNESRSARNRNDSDTSNSSMNSTSIPACYQGVKKTKKKQKNVSSSESELSGKMFKRKQKSKKIRKI